MSNGTNHIESLCHTCYSHKKPCNFFVQAVAKGVSVTLPSYGNADDLIGEAVGHWKELSAKEAISAADQGLFVIAGMTSKELTRPKKHVAKGHVAIVLPHSLMGFPRVAATNEDDGHWGKSRGDKSLTEVFPAALVRANADGKKVRYFCPPLVLQNLGNSE